MRKTVGYYVRRYASPLHTCTALNYFRASPPTGPVNRAIKSSSNIPRLSAL
nr:MAG TPA: hypothetical protein [Caudoviricetes sp.]